MLARWQISDLSLFSHLLGLLSPFLDWTVETNRRVSSLYERAVECGYLARSSVDAQDVVQPSASAGNGPTGQGEGDRGQIKVCTVRQFAAAAGGGCLSGEKKKSEMRAGVSFAAVGDRGWYLMKAHRRLPEVST